MNLSIWPIYLDYAKRFKQNSSKISQNRLLKNIKVCHFKTTGRKLLIFGQFTLEVYQANSPKEQWAGNTHMGYTPTLKMGVSVLKKTDRRIHMRGSVHPKED